MIKNLMEKVTPKEKDTKDPEILELRKKFQEIKKTPVNVSPDKPPQNSASSPSSDKSESEKPKLKDIKVKLVDAEQAENDERMTNMIMDQIRELIEIDSNLNNKIKDVEGKISSTNSELEKIKKQNEEHATKMDRIEKSMEKFMALYEVVTNQYNPFVESSPKEPAQSGVNQIIDNAKQETDTIKEVPVTTEEMPQAEVKQDEVKQEISVEPQVEVKDEIKQETHQPLTAHEVDSRINKALDNFRAEHSNNILSSVDSKMKETLAKIEDSINSQLQNSIFTSVEQIIDSKIKGNIPEVPSDTENKEDPHSEEVHADNYFYLPSGKPVKSLRELVEEINVMSDEDFQSHVSTERNDFAEWIEHVISNRILAEQIRPLKTKQEISSALIAHIGN